MADQPPSADRAFQPPVPSPADFDRLIGAKMLAALLEATAEQGRPGRRANETADLLDALTRCRRAPSDSPAVDLVQNVARMYAAGLAGGFRFWGRMIGAWADIIPAMADAFADTTASRRRRASEPSAALDELLDRLADLRGGETTRLQAELVAWLSSAGRESKPWTRRPYRAKL